MAAPSPNPDKTPAPKPVQTHKAAKVRIPSREIEDCHLRDGVSLVGDEIELLVRCDTLPAIEKGREPLLSRSHYLLGNRNLRHVDHVRAKQSGEAWNAVVVGGEESGANLSGFDSLSSLKTWCQQNNLHLKGEHGGSL